MTSLAEWNRTRDLLTRHHKPMRVIEEDPNLAVMALPLVDLRFLDHAEFELVGVKRSLKTASIHTLDYTSYWGKAASMPYSPYVTLFRFERRDPNECFICTWEGCKACRLQHRCPQCDCENEVEGL